MQYRVPGLPAVLRPHDGHASGSAPFAALGWGGAGGFGAVALGIGGRGAGGAGFAAAPAGAGAGAAGLDGTGRAGAR